MMDRAHFVPFLDAHCLLACLPCMSMDYPRSVLAMHHSSMMIFWRDSWQDMFVMIPWMRMMKGLGWEGSRGIH